MGSFWIFNWKNNKKNSSKFSKPTRAQVVILFLSGKTDPIPIYHNSPPTLHLNRPAFKLQLSASANRQFGVTYAISICNIRDTSQLQYNYDHQRSVEKNNNKKKYLFFKQSQLSFCAIFDSLLVCRFFNTENRIIILDSNI